MRIALALLPLAALMLAGCSSGSGGERDEIRRFAEAVADSDCPKAGCAAQAEDDEEFLEIVTN